MLLSFCAIYLCIVEGKKFEPAFSNFLNIERLELDFSNFLTIARSTNTELFNEALQSERCLWNLNSVIHKNRYKKVKSRKKLAEQFSVTSTAKSCSKF